MFPDSLYKWLLLNFILVFIVVPLELLVTGLLPSSETCRPYDLLAKL